MPVTQSSKVLTPEAFMAQQLTPDAFMGQQRRSEKPGFLDKEILLDSYGNATLSGIQSLGRGFRTIKDSIVKPFTEPETPEEKAHREQMEAAGGTQPDDPFSRGLHRIVRGTVSSLMGAPGAIAQVPGAVSDINASPDPRGTYAKVAQETSGEGAAQAVAALAPEGLVRGAPMVRGTLAKALPPIVRGAGKTYNAARSAGQVVAPVAGLVEGASRLAQGDPMGAFYSATGGGIAGHVLKTLPEASESITSFGRPKPTYPGAPFPEAPPPELTQAAALFRGAQTVPDPAAGLGEIPVRGAIAEQVQQPIARPSLKQMMGSLQEPLDQAVGAKKLIPNVPLKQQIPGRGGVAQQMKPPIEETPAAQQSAAMPPEPELPEGHTAVESSALRSYRYDPAAREFHARATSGDTVYVYGDVSPEGAAAFENAPSKGQAWQLIRRNPLVAKIVNGKRIAVKPATSSQ